MINAFDKGSRLQFLDLWHKGFKRLDHDGNILEFYCCIYFSVYPLHECNPHKGTKEDLTKELSKLKATLESIEIKSSDSENLLTYYALPFVKSPQTHPSFSHLFTSDWSNQLRASIQKYINNQSSELENIYTHYLKCANKSVSEQTPEINSHSDDNYSVSSKAISGYEPRKSSEQYIYVEEDQSLVNNGIEKKEDIMNSQLDIEKIKELLLVCDDPSMLYRIIYELKARISHAHRGFKRKYVIISYIVNDILGIGSQNNEMHSKFMINSPKRYM